MDSIKVNIIRCFLCHKRSNQPGKFKFLDLEVCSASQKDIKTVLEFIVSKIDNCDNKIDFEIPRNEQICLNCFNIILDYDAAFVSLLNKEKKLTALVEKALMDIDSECENDLYNYIDNVSVLNCSDIDASMSEEDERSRSFNRNCLIPERSVSKAISRKFHQNTRDFEEDTSRNPNNFSSKCGGKRLKKVITSEGNQEFICTECHLKFPNYCEYRRHQRKTHFAGYVCHECGKFIKDFTGFKNHMLNHSQIKQFPCPVCGQQFAHPKTLKHHMAWHTGESNFECEICGKRFVHRVNLLKHQLIHDESTRKYCCQRCHYKFRSKSQLTRHMMTHTKQKPHICPICERGFALIYNLRTHVREHRQPGSTRRARLKCKNCGKGFTSAHNYDIHCKSNICLANKLKKNV